MFAAIILGGLDSILGAIVASLIIGWVEAVAAGYLGGKSRDVVPYVVVLAILVVRPYGLFGTRTIERALIDMRTGVFHETFASEERLWRLADGARLDARVRAGRCSRCRSWGSDYVLAMACIVGIHVIATLGLNITTGNAGLISLGHAAFLGVGCYTVRLARQAGRAVLPGAAGGRR